MALRTLRKGHLRLEMVTCAVALSKAATDTDDIAFRTLNRATGHPVKIEWRDSVTSEPVMDKMKAVEIDDNEFVEVDEAEIDALKPSATHTMTLKSFVADGSVPSLFRDQPYFMRPADAAAREAFAVIHAAMVERGMSALSCIVMSRREHPVVIEAVGDGMMMTTLRYERNIIPAEEAYEHLEEAKPDKEMVAIASDIIDRKAGAFDPTLFVDSYADALRELVQAKISGKAFKGRSKTPATTGGKSLLDVLRRSLNESGGRAAPLRAAAKRQASERVSARSKAKRRA